MQTGCLRYFAYFCEVLVFSWSFLPYPVHLIQATHCPCTLGNSMQRWERLSTSSVSPLWKCFPLVLFFFFSHANIRLHFLLPIWNRYKLLSFYFPSSGCLPPKIRSVDCKHVSAFSLLSSSAKNWGATATRLSISSLTVAAGSPGVNRMLVAKPRKNIAAQ